MSPLEQTSQVGRATMLSLLSPVRLRGSMAATFDIFKVTRGELRWLGAADTIEAAKVRIEERTQTAPGNFVIHNQKTAEAIRVISGNEEKRSPQQPRVEFSTAFKKN